MTDREHRTTVRMPESLSRRCRVKAVKLGVPLSEVIRTLLEKWERGEIELPELGNHLDE
jgi:hypothetical protein